MWRVVAVSLSAVLLMASFRSGAAAGAAAEPNAAVSLTQILTQLEGGFVDVEGSLSPDGNTFAGTEWNTGNLALWDTTTGKMTLVTDEGWAKPGNNFPEAVVWSPDG